KHIHELALRSGKWRDTILQKEVPKAPAIDGDPFGFSDERLGTQHVLYTAKDGDLALVSAEGPRWRLTKLNLAKPKLDPIGPLISPFFYEDLEHPHTFFVEPSLAEKTVHDWEEYVVTTEEYTEYDVPNFAELVPWFPVRIPITPSDWGIIKKPLSDPVLG